MEYEEFIDLRPNLQFRRHWLKQFPDVLDPKPVGFFEVDKTTNHRPEDPIH